MKIKEIYSPEVLDNKAKALFEEERAISRLDGWFIIRELACDIEEANVDMPNIIRKANALKLICERLPIFISDNAVFAGTQRDAFAKSYALINPTFRVENFNGYCDPTAVFNDIEPNAEFWEDRINKVRGQTSQTEYVKKLKEVYGAYELDMSEVAYFVEQVTGHLIPDFKHVLQFGICAVSEQVKQKCSHETDVQKINTYKAMQISLDAVLILAQRYEDIVRQMQSNCSKARLDELKLMEKTLHNVPLKGAETLYEALQSFILLWQVMCIEQAPNPFAFSVGNADRIFEPYREKENLDREITAGLLKHFLVFFNIGDRSWAISQNLIIGGKANDGKDLTSLTSYALLDAYYAMNLPQPILSVKLHSSTPQRLYEEMGRFLFTPGCLTPSFFNDDAVFELLFKSGIEKEDLENYSIAGCQEPLIMGKDNGNTTNSWLNLAKILEITLNGGQSLISGRQLLPDFKTAADKNSVAFLKKIRTFFYENVEYYVRRMADAANGVSFALAELPVPFLSCFMGCIESGVDLRDPKIQGTKYNGSGCLIHGLSVVADSFIAIDRLLKERPQDAGYLIDALKNDFVGHDDLHDFLQKSNKYGNNLTDADGEAVAIASKISDLVCKQKNYLGNPFRADWSSPTTHLLYGYWVGATPDGRRSREMLGYGVDPFFGEATNGLGFRMLSVFKLPFEKFCGGYASHFGLDPKYFNGANYAEKGIEFGKKIIQPLFFSASEKIQPFYLYVNVTTTEILRKVLADPKKYAPSGIYIMRIHGTFVNFLDLSPEIQEDIIKRLDLESTKFSS